MSRKQIKKVTESIARTWCRENGVTYVDHDVCGVYYFDQFDGSRYHTFLSVIGLEE